MILERLVALNAERAAEEARGVVRWLRPAYQLPRAGLAPTQPALLDEAAGAAPAVGISLRFTEGDTPGVESAVASSLEVLEAGGVSVRLTPLARGAARPIHIA